MLMQSLCNDKVGGLHLLVVSLSSTEERSSWPHGLDEEPIIIISGR